MFASLFATTLWSCASALQRRGYNEDRLLEHQLAAVSASKVLAGGVTEEPDSLLQKQMQAMTSTGAGIGQQVSERLPGRKNYNGGCDLSRTSCEIRQARVRR